MCIAYPGHVIAVDVAGAVVDTEGRRQRASLLLEPGVVVGDWVVVAAGTIIAILPPDEAAQVIAILDAAREDASGEPDAALPA
jgi:hydrogenase assembly chaperone HypC/HupF